MASKKKAAKKKRTSRVEFDSIPRHLAPGAKGVKRGKFFEMEFLKNFLQKKFDIKTIPARLFVPELVEMTEEAVIVVPQFKKGYRIDFLLINPRNKRKIAIETRYKAVQGSDQERFEHWFSKAEHSRIPSILAFGGAGWTEKYVGMAKDNIKKFGWVIDIFNYEDEKTKIYKTIKSTLRLRRSK
jgi:hypothetical protein